MGLSCGGKFLKFLVFFFNAIVFIGGCVIVGFGASMMVKAKQTEGLISDVLPITILVLGLLLFLVGFLGCFGACYNNTCMLKTFAIIVGILLLAEIIAGIVVLVYRHDFVKTAGEAMKKAIEGALKSGTVGKDPTVKAIDKFQKKYKCCGGTGPDDWGKGNYPASCCSSKKGNCNDPYRIGCAEGMYEHFKDSALGIGAAMVAIALVQIGAIVCAAILASKMNEYEEV